MLASNRGLAGVGVFFDSGLISIFGFVVVMNRGFPMLGGDGCGYSVRLDNGGSWRSC